ncbi:MAG: sulfatase-like hydrolase/transferase [Nitrospirota bacterium]
MKSTLQLKIIVFLCVVLAGIFLTWKFLDKFDRWAGILQERITPLVWLFGIWVILSVPLVSYYTWIKPANLAVHQNISQTTTDNKSRPNIILITFDALTARDMSVYGYHRPTTPFISEWAKSGSIFIRLEAESNFTTATTASLMTGKRVWTHQTYQHLGSKPVKADIENLPLVLKNNGYYTMAFVANPAASVRLLGIADSFDIAPLATEFSAPASLIYIINKKLHQLFGDKIRLHDWITHADFIFYRFLNLISRDFSITIFPAEKVFKKFLSVIDENPPEPYFTWIHIFPPHSPYLPPLPYMRMYDSSYELATEKSRAGIIKKTPDKYQFKYYQHFPREVQPAIDTMRARYDEFIRYCDNEFENFMKKLANKNELQNAVIILSSDHGESFDHNYRDHGGVHLYEQVTSIPLIIKEPDRAEGRIINDLTEQIDIPPTILDLADIPAPQWMEGRSLLPLMRGGKISSRPAFSMNFEKNPSLGHKITRGTVAVWENDYKLIHYFDATGNKSLLFNLKQDPDEQNDLFEKEPEAGQRLLTLIQKNLKEANERISRGE